MPSSFPGRQPTTTQSAVRTRFTFTIPLRSPGRYGASSCFATTPSPDSSHGAAFARLFASGVSSTEPAAVRFLPPSAGDQRLEALASVGKRSGEQLLLSLGEEVERP